MILRGGCLTLLFWDRCALKVEGVETSLHNIPAVGSIIFQILAWFFVCFATFATALSLVGVVSNPLCAANMLNIYIYIYWLLKVSKFFNSTRGVQINTQNPQIEEVLCWVCYC
jgi:hypothetical protein